MTSNHFHPSEIYTYSLSRLLERFSYYGVRSILVLYMLSEIINMDETHVFEIYGYLTGSIVITSIIGALLGDLVIGNKLAIIIGGILKTVGIFMLCIPDIKLMFFGLGLIYLGEGFYSPNMIAIAGKLYLNKPKLMDAGYLIFYIAINIGAFLAPLVIGYYGEINFTYGFIIAGIAMLVSTIIAATQIKDIEPSTDTKQKNIEAIHVFYILGAMLFSAIFWIAMDICGGAMFGLIRENDYMITDTMSFIEQFWSLNTLIIVFGGILFVVIWTQIQFSRIVKLLISTLLGITGYYALILANNQDNAVLLIYGYAILLGTAEIFLMPTVLSIMTQNSNPKYLATLMALLNIPTRVIMIYVTGVIMSLPLLQTENLSITFMVSTVILALCIIPIGIALILKHTVFKVKEEEIDTLY